VIRNNKSFKTHFEKCHLNRKVFLHTPSRHKPIIALRSIYTIHQIVSYDTIFTDRINPIFVVRHLKVLYKKFSLISVGLCKYTVSLINLSKKEEVEGVGDRLEHYVGQRGRRQKQRQLCVTAAGRRRGCPNWAWCTSAS
jgi:hypothetical protein